MAGKVRFYRGAPGTSLPATRQDGAIFIIERTGTDASGYNLGDMYVDMDNGKRLHIIPDAELITYNSSMSGTTSTLGQVYVFQEQNKNGIAVGDGKAYIGDLPVYDPTITETIAKHASAIQNKINAYLGTDYRDNLTLAQKTADNINPPSSTQERVEETLVLSRELWLDF